MMDALLHAVRDNVYRDLGYDVRTCDIRDDGHPPPRCGSVFLAIHQGGVSSDMQNALDEYFDFALTLTMRVSVPLERIGDRQLAIETTQDSGWNRKAHRVKNYLHMAWGILQDANQYLVDWNPDAPTVYGFCEPARFADMETPVLVGGEWFGADLEAGDVGLQGAIRFVRARRLQALTTFT